jgi:predicted transposase/invertase (TIGR01784 family)
MESLLNPKLDLVFKLLFSGPGCEDLLISLLTAVLRPAVPIVSVQYLARETEKTEPDDRGVYLDVLVRLNDGTTVDVEMQSRSHRGMPKRALFHWSRMYDRQAKPGTEYTAIKPCISIFLLDYNQLRSSRFHSTFEVLEIHDHEPLEPGQLQVHLVELRKLPAAGSQERASEGKLGDWARFFKAVDEAELQELAMTDPIFDKAKKELERLSADEEVRLRAQLREDALRMYEMELYEAKAEGKAEGKTEGKTEGKAEASAQALLTFLRARGLTIPDAVRDRVLACTDLDTLDRWIAGAAKCSSAEDLLAKTR